MKVTPAIDILGGRCVRLFRGRYDQATVYDDNPLAVAQRFVAAGAPALHIVDLDGAHAGKPCVLDVVRRIAAVGVPVTLGGGIRTRADAQAALAHGAARVIVGSRAVAEPAWLARLLNKLGPAVLVGALDLDNDAIRINGWTRVAPGVSGSTVWDAWVAAGLSHAIVTDTLRDGTLGGINSATYHSFADGPIAVTAAGGVGCSSDLDDLAVTGVAGAVVGRAIYDGHIPLTELEQRRWVWSPRNRRERA